MEISGGRRKGKGGEFEEGNILAIVDASGAKHTKDANDDRIAFLEAVRAVSILSENGSPPTEKMNQEVFKILRIGKTLELVMASYQLLMELDESFPRVYLANADKLQSGTDAIPELVVVKEAWSPFVPMLEFSISTREAGKDSDGPIDSYGFHLLVQELVELADETKFQKSDMESLRKLLLFQYLVNVLEADFLLRNSAYSSTMEWNLLRESLLSMLLGSRKINYKNLMKDCITIMCRFYHIFASFTDDLIPQESTLGESAKSSDPSVTFALLEVGKNVCIAMQKFLTMIMELDTSKKKAEMEGCTTRVDGIRTPVVELILDELTYNTDTIQPFLQVCCEPKWKLELVVQYLWKYIAKPSVRTRRSNTPEDNVSFRGALKCLSNISTTRSTIKKIDTEVIQLLLVHGFQAYLSLPSKDSDVPISSESDESTSYSPIELCKDVISAFKTLRQTDKDMEILSFGKEALFTAATIISMKS